ncbi:Protein phosphatase 2C-like protein C10F6.17c [Psilocybe cubensis]|uniref:PPM-type phosphatase domain-containing protein n=2 Tax=Psilocybe cubensis TaxID=181762 RepID=A0A8H8CNA1_PSICU|nr:Protein phosphatase 2C-like protein C10F6.17c [Psilocybe cubensis]KAH9485310.1 Protein phosphatase 2C-like protein C10F6.17c [Psilocybe cubensis]
MDAKLKALKVVDLRNILATARVQVPAKATKNDLIAKILASNAALDTYAALYPPDDLLAPPEEVDWNEDQIDTPPPQQQQQQQQQKVAPAPAPAPEPAPQSAPTPAPAPVAPSDTTQSSAEDIELEKRKQRAARFGIPLVEPHQKKTRPAAKSAAVAASIDPKVLEQRAARFGLNTQAPDAKANSNGKKRSAPTTQDVDPEELERRRKRAERFGTGIPRIQPNMTPELVKKTTDMGWSQTDALWVYTSLPEPLLSSELERLSFAHTKCDTDVVGFQPCPNPEETSQDRFVINDWPLPNGTWIFRAIFDGHAGHETADYASSALPDIIKGALTAVVEKDAHPSSSAVSEALSNAISSFDKGIGQAIVDLFPDEQALAEMPIEDIQRIINDNGPNSATILKGMRGTTALVSLADPAKANIWVASLGDCAAVLGLKEISGEWNAQVLSKAHNGENDVEEERVRQEHPGEEECMMDNRVLGAIAVTRAIGDFSFKLPAIYTERVFLNSNPGFLVPDKVRGYIGRSKTPPYMTGVPEVEHINLKALNATSTFLIMCSDGLTDLYDDRLKLNEVLASRWVGIVGEQYGLKDRKNLALTLLRDGLGADEENKGEKISRMITVEMAFKWMDDTTILVVPL